MKNERVDEGMEEMHWEESKEDNRFTWPIDDPILPSPCIANMSDRGAEFNTMDHSVTRNE